VFDRALRYFRRAPIGDPDNFELVRDFAISCPFAVSISTGVVTFFARSCLHTS